jgi:anti-sigma factor RsiW
VSCATTTSLGAYVLGALDDRERDRVDEHVAGCSRCREELESLIPLRSYLARVAAEEPDSVGAPPPALRARVQTAVRAERWRVVRRRFATVAALGAFWRGRPAGLSARVRRAPREGPEPGDAHSGHVGNP